MRSIIVHDRIFEMCPDFMRGLVIVEDITNHIGNEAIQALLSGAIEGLADMEIGADERLKAWDEAHRKFGSNPNKFPPSIKSLLKRIKSNPRLPFVNSVVALFNYISLKYGLPCGGDDAERIEGDLVLGIAEGTETFLPLGADKAETPVAGEVIYYDSSTRTVMCRRWNWRNGDQTKIGPATRRLVINIDCLPPCGPESAFAARDELAALLVRHCAARLCVGALHAGARRHELNI